MDRKFDKAEYDKEYQRSHKTRITLWFNNDKDEDLIRWLSDIEINRSEYIRDLIRTDMNRKKQERGRIV